MNYKVVKAFTDLQDNRHVYNAGDQFPRDGVDVSEDRLKELSSADNKRGVPLIKADEPMVELDIEVVPDEEAEGAEEADAEPAVEEKPKKTSKKKRSENAD